MEIYDLSYHYPRKSKFVARQESGYSQCEKGKREKANWKWKIIISRETNERDRLSSRSLFLDRHKNYGCINDPNFRWSRHLATVASIYGQIVCFEGAG